MAEPLRAQLERGIDALQLEVTPTQLEQLLAYRELIERWNRAYNLTAVRDANSMVTRHLLDSLAVAPYVHAHRIIDVGTGAGLPGIPLALLYPDRHFDLLDSNGKKTRFLFQVKSQLGLSNIGIVENRVEQYQPEQRYDAVISRAFANLARMVQQCSHLIAADGLMFAMKAASVEEELAELGDAAERVAQYSLHVPGLDEERSLVVLRQI